MSDDCDNEKLLIVRNKFLCCVPVTEIDLKEHLKGISWNGQAILLKYTINNCLLQKYPIKVSYQKVFLKTLINVLEQSCDEVHDSLYDTYCTLLSTTDDAKYCYKHYCINEKIVTLKENKNFISEGTTGLCSWQAALALSEYCLNNKEHFQQKTILELGSGIGLVGITVALNCQPTTIYLTDCHPKVLTVLTENVLLNIASNSSGGSKKFESVNSHTIKETFTVDSINFDTVDGTISANFDNARTVNRGSVNCHTIKETSSAEFDCKSNKDNSETVRYESVNCSAIKETVSAGFDSTTVKNCVEPVCYSTIEETLSAVIDSTVTVNALQSDNREPANCHTVKEPVKQPSEAIENTISVNESVNDAHTTKFGKKLNHSSDVLLQTVKDVTSVYVLNLPWESVLENQCCSAIIPDLILAADVVYDNSVFQSLCGAVKYFLDSNSKCKVIFACTERNSNTLNEFINLLEINNFNIEELSSPKSKYLYWSTEIPIRFFMVSVK